MTPVDIRDRWLAGTVCERQRFDVREVLFANATHIVLKHRSHSEWVDRVVGVKTCTAYAQLHHRDTLIAGMDKYGGLFVKPMKVWTGRINRKQVLADCAMLGIVFEVEKKGKKHVAPKQTA